MAVLGTLVMQAAPAMRTMVEGRAARQQAETLQTALRRARDEALARGERVTLCARASAAVADDAGATTCAAPEARDWNAGWVVFVDRGARGVLDADDRTLWVDQPQPHQLPWTATAGAISFEWNGVSSRAATRFNVNPAQTAAVSVCVNKPGRSRLVEGPSCSG